jgi:short-subunit dehydrogenase
MSRPARTALVTGASGGIGRALARALHARGTELVLTGRRRQALEALGAQLGARTVVCDLRRRDAVSELVSAAGEIDVLVANAGVQAGGVLTELEQEEIDAMLEVNLRAPIALARALAPGMVARGRGHLVFISSLSGRAASPASSLYCATKFGLRGFALALREDLRAHGVGVSVILPGFIAGAGMFADAGVRLPPGVGTRSPEDVARAVLEAIDHDRAEVCVAPALLRAGAAVAGLWPTPAAAVARLGGSHRIARQLAAAHAPRREA